MARCVVMNYYVTATRLQQYVECCHRDVLRECKI